MTFREGHRRLAEELMSLYEKAEAFKIADLVFEKITGSGKKEFVLISDSGIPETHLQTLEKYKSELLQHRPVQYVLNEAWFHGRKFFVDERVLIPRPETDELAEWVMQEVNNRQRATVNAESEIRNLQILDIGTGSGCIPVSIKKRFAQLSVTGIDVCSEALYVAAENAATHETDIELMLIDFLNKEEWNKLGIFDIVVSNPPYVPQKEKSSMAPNVLNYEPHKALFVPDNDALLFYEAIAQFGKEHLSAGGSIFAEIHETLANNVDRLFRSHGYTFTEIRKDMQGKERMIKVRKEAQ